MTSFPCFVNCGKSECSLLGCSRVRRERDFQPVPGSLLALIRSNVEIQAGPRRAAQVCPNVQIADRVAREWGEGLWTHFYDYKVAVLAVTPVSERTRGMEL